ncbi:MAG: hypothetical protein ACYC7D_15370 [Nitrososphaerales archaeon]
MSAYGLFIGKHIQSCYRPERTGFEDAAEIEMAGETGSLPGRQASVYLADRRFRDQFWMEKMPYPLWM